ncbi:MAG: ABC transporter permease [Pirellulales bacterium]|nr:ABC transporter permease [Pirellulales bacterium]
MLNYLVRRILIGAFTLLLITFVIYGLIRHMPGNPMDTDPAMMDPSKMISKADLERLLAVYGLDKPWYEAYFTWLKNACTFEFGTSFSVKKPVLALIKDAIGPTLQLSITSLILTYLLALPMGLYSTVRSGKTEERAMSFVLYMLYSFPSFVAALFLQLLFAIKLGDTWFELPLMGAHDPDYESFTATERAWDSFKHMILPVTCFTYGSLAYYCRFIKANMEEVIRQDYIRTAKAKGLGPIRILIHHAFRNTLIPFVTLLGLTLPGLLSGAIILEQIFNWPGMGTLFFDSIGTRDYTVLMTITLMFSVLTLLGQLIADILYAFVDPRIRYN